MYIMIGFYFILFNFKSTDFLMNLIRFTGRTRNRPVWSKFFSLNVQLIFFVKIRLDEWSIPS